MKKTVPIESLPGFEDIEPNMYVIHSEGGPHYFSQCSMEVKPIYKQKIWPYLERIKTHSVTTTARAAKPGIMLGSIAKTKLSYVKHVLYKNKKNLKLKKDYRGKKIRTLNRPINKEANMHRLVALAFVPNPDPKNKILVDHINGNRVDFRPENLRWSSNEENSVGSPGGKHDPNEIYKLLSEKNWFNNKGANVLETKKSAHLKSKK